jgi:hypothetical protein
MDTVKLSKNYAACFACTAAIFAIFSSYFWRIPLDSLTIATHLLNTG